ncbi:indole-3-glycerol phosphate synthase TrpC [Jutongia sp.]
MTILNEIAAKTRERVKEQKRIRPLEQLMDEAQEMNSDTGYPFEKAIGKDGLSFICEVKKASPSKGVIAQDFPYVEIAKDYEEGGASAISVLTEPYWFQGSDQYLREIRQAVSLPIIRKDFVVDEYMIYEAKLMGADAVLLICAILNDEELKKFFQIADSLGLTALVEAHDQEEVDRALKAGARLIGVNNRDLHTFTVDINNSIRYRQSVPDNVLFVSESGIRTKEDIRQLMDNNVNGVLIGETMMRAQDRVAAVREFIGYSR